MFAVLFAGCAAPVVAELPEASAHERNEIFAWAGASGLEPGLSTKLFGATYGRYLTNWLQIEGGLEGYRDGFSGEWLRLNALFGPGPDLKVRPYFLAGSSSGWPELGGGLKVRVTRSVGARFDFTFALDDDEGWYSNIRGGILLSF